MEVCVVFFVVFFLLAEPTSLTSLSPQFLLFSRAPA